MAAKPKYNAPYHDNWAWSLAAMGATNEEIALAMGVSERTIMRYLMSKGAYTYEPGNITEFGKDRMRFELGDTMVEGLADTTALTDEEIQAAIDAYPNKWKRAKLMLLESLCRRFAYEVNTKTGPLSLDMNGRAKLWKEDYDKLKKEVQAESVSVPRFGNGVDGPPYFHTGMHENERVWNG